MSDQLPAESNRKLTTSGKPMSEALLKISESAFCVAIKESKHDIASSLMPTKYLQVQEQPKVREMIEIAGFESVQSMIEYELIQLALLMSVGGNLNKAQVPFIAEQLIELYPNESIADFKLCFRKGSIGEYGDIQRLDGITIGNWMKAYLDKKYEAIESDLMKQKEDIYKPVEVKPSSVDWHKKWLDELKAIEAPKRVPLTKEDIEKEGQPDPKPKPYPYTPKEMLIQNERHTAWIRANFNYLTGEKLPTFEEEKEWISKHYKL